MANEETRPIPLTAVLRWRVTGLTLVILIHFPFKNLYYIHVFYYSYRLPQISPCFLFVFLFGEIKAGFKYISNLSNIREAGGGRIMTWNWMVLRQPGPHAPPAHPSSLLPPSLFPGYSSGISSMKLVHLSVSTPASSMKLQSFACF